MNEPRPPSPAPAEPGRRQFLAKTAAVGAGAAALGTPLLAGLATILDPLGRKAAASEPVFVTSLSALPEDGAPRRFPILADRSDAWNKFPAVPVGAIYLRRLPGQQVQAYNVTCPHAGCAVEFRPEMACFLCPCHDSRFGLDGSRLDPHSPSRRPLDTLETEVRHGREIWVRFQNFEAGKAEKIPLA
ncbi:MAG: hypothetical protein RJA22_2145 [Verrucomicrobiota bacterium]|jgi:Rieske Fe-S protein